MTPEEKLTKVYKLIEERLAQMDKMTATAVVFYLGEVILQ